jgi:hypothetical protein
MLLSAVFIITGIIILSLFVNKYWSARPYWLITIVSLLILSLIGTFLVDIVNIFFCFYNEQFWLYASEDYFYSMYYLVLVSYICYHYVLTHAPEEKEDLMRKLNINLRLETQEPKSSQRVIFFCVVGVLTALYLTMYIISVIEEIDHDP